MSVLPFSLKRILVPIDFSGPAQNAIHKAIEIADHCDGRITMIHVIEPYRLTAEFVEFGPPAADVPEAAKKRLSTLASHFGNPARFGEGVVRVGRPEYEIGAAAREMSSDLVVITTHGYTGLDYILLGGTAERIVRHTTSPILVLRKHNNHPLDFKKILVPLSLYPSSLVGLRYACKFAKAFGAKITALHALEPLGPLARLQVNPDLYEEKVRTAAKWRLEEMQAEVDHPADTFETRIKDGPAYHEILQTARLENYGLIILSALRRSGLGDMFLGTTVEHVVRHAPCPVLVVRGSRPELEPA